MKNRIFCTLLVWVLLMAATIVTTQAAEVESVYAASVEMTAQGVFSQGGTVTALCPYCGTDAQWEELSAITATKNITGDVHYYLSRDLSNKGFYFFYDNACLHLNGHTIQSSVRAVYVETGARLNIMGDGGICGKGVANSVTCDRGGALDVVGIANLFGGTYTHTTEFPVITARGSKNCQVNIYDGTRVSGTSGINGSNLYIYNSQLNIYGGTVENGIAERGGNICGDKNAKINIAGGTVTGGTVYLAENAASLTLSGSPRVDVINLFDGPKAEIGGLSQGADIAIVAQGAFTEQREDIADFAGYFHSPNELVKLSIQDGALFGTVDTTGDSDAPLCDGKTLKILCLTSSFGLNTTELLYDIAVAEGFEDVAVARLYASGCSLEKHVNSYNKDVGIYWYTKFTKDGKVSVYDAKMLDGLLDEDWDIIFIQQGAEQTPQLDRYVDYLDQLMEIVNTHKTNPNAKFIWNMTWAFQSDNTRKIFTDTFQGDQLLMHEAIIDAMQEKILTRSDFSALIPTGAAVQSARTSYFGDRLTKDTLHLNNLGRVIAGYTVLATVTDKNISEVNVGAVKSYDLTTAIRLSESDRKVVIEAVNAARSDPFSVHPSQYTPEYYNSLGEKAQALSFSTGAPTDAQCPYCDNLVTWQPLTGSSANKLTTTDGNWGHYYLAEDLTYSGKYLYVTTEEGHVGYCLHLNGHNITSTGKRALWVGAGNTMNIMGFGTVSGVGEGSSDSDYRGAALDVNGHVNLFGGTYMPLAARPAVLLRTSATRVNIFDGAVIQGNSSYSAPLIQPNIASAEVNMFGGTVTSGNAENGGNIYIPKNAVFNMFGGTVKDGSATRFGGNVYASNGSVNIYGGNILGGNVENTSSSYGRGGNVAICGVKGANQPAFRMYGGTLGSVTGDGAGYASAGGANLYVSYGTADIMGKDAVIAGGAAKSYGGNIMISAEAYVTLSDGTVQAGTASLGGNVYMAGTSSHFTINGGTVADGAAQKNGGNLYANNGYFTFNGGTCKGGTAVTAGNLYLKVGYADADNMAIIHHDPTLSKTAPVITGGTATGSGGSIYADYNVSLGTFTVSDGNAKTGGNLYAAKHCTLTVLEGFDSTTDACFDSATVDLAGHNAAISGSGSITCYDSANEDLKTFGTLTLSGVTLTNTGKLTLDGKDYYTVGENGSYSFHRLTMDISSVSLRPGSAGMYFGGTWRCDEMLAKKITGYGVVVSTHNMPGDNFQADPESDNLWSSYTALQSGTEMQGVLVDGILKTTDEARIRMNAAYGKMPICSAAYITLEENTYVSSGVSMSLHDMLTALQTAAPADRRQDLAAFMEHWKAYGLADWSFDFAQ